MTQTRRGHIVMLTRQDCPLCARTEHQLRRFAKAFAISVDTVDVDTDPALAEEYGDRIPVLLGVGSRVLAEGHISNFGIQKALLRVRLGR